jgi:hypothetical protein
MVSANGSVFCHRQLSEQKSEIINIANINQKIVIDINQVGIYQNMAITNNMLFVLFKKNTNFIIRRYEYTRINIDLCML